MEGNQRVPEFTEIVLRLNKQDKCMHVVSYVLTNSHYVHTIWGLGYDS